MNHSIASKIRRGAARLPWSVRWGYAASATAKPIQDAYAAAPRAPDWAVQWADALLARVEQLNGATTTELYGRCKHAGYKGDSEQFGVDLASLSLEWFDTDAHPDFPRLVSVPRSAYTDDLATFPPVRIVG
jgi:hypothetical protein